MSSKTVDENYRRLRAELDELLSKDKRLTAIADKISKGTADFSDTARYTQIVSKHMSDVIKHNIGELKQPMAKEMVCKELLRDHYELINGVFGEVQVSVDEKLGVHLNVKKPAYPAERVDKWAHSLEDPTVEPSVTERRAASGSENIGNSIHDNCIKENAKWREQAGLDCYLTRDAGGGCCPWCQALAGRYSYADAPDDIFRRHDNCTCTVTYECGRKRQDVWSKKTWEADPKDVDARIEASEAAKPVSLTQEQARAINEQSKSNITVLSKEKAEAINEQNQPIVFTEAEAKEREAMALGKDDNVNNLSLEKQDESGIMKSGAISGGLKPDSERASEHAERYYESVRHMTTDVKTIAANTGFAEDDIASIKDFVFMQKHELGNGEPEYFLPDYAMAQSWQRLIEGKNIQPHDITLLNHEKMEQELMKQGLSQGEAHALTEKKYNYAKESKDYYAEIEKHKNKR